MLEKMKRPFCAHAFSFSLFCFSDWIDLDRLMGKVASDKCHKWVFKEPTECEPNISNYWQSSFDAVWKKEKKKKRMLILLKHFDNPS